MANASQQPQTTAQFLRIAHLAKQLQVSKSTIWAWLKAGKFPKPVKLSDNCTAWLAADVEAWAADRIAASQPAK